MSTHERMVTDYVWIRDHSQADSWAKARTHGYNYLYYHAPNKSERLEMIHRSIGKQYDWELERFRASKKYPDRGNKKRLFKNFFRFLKHPIGMIYWRSYKFRLAKGRAQTTFLAWAMILSVVALKKQSWRNRKKDHFLLLSGENVEGSKVNPIGYNHQEWGPMILPLHTFMFQPLQGRKVTVNPARDQVYRKYFEIRKKYNIRGTSANQQLPTA
eukprot:TRINITY_DN3476_c0_g1_i1.p1 TRINITY_DN3476_c0_g1~~TRINITY_DN3476_c0_g1_i1.p1  ORF type:complete len:214 (-),score=45.80 TRINITY_DN3476_c0_g1_i1:101-742(-)